MKIITADSVNVSKDLAHAKKMDVNVYLQKSVLKYSIHFSLAYACAFWNAIRSYKKVMKNTKFSITWMLSN
ncbi:hypothetical protein BBD40_24360 [Paenibacillus ihbetae]|uniref:Uncharacterized protein n=1 Tax=Paenibacillus ihbetae TaxID=1870820 RepID=A0ABX3JPN5_9BACL|nr:hypothetical protein BBD40_24360 [Paenibacillus ihbetae]